MTILSHHKPTTYILPADLELLERIKAHQLGLFGYYREVCHTAIQTDEYLAHCLYCSQPNQPLHRKTTLTHPQHNEDVFVCHIL